MKTHSKVIAAFTVIFGLIAISFSSTDDPIKTLKDSTAVVQLFTSQGCSSCPSADKLLEKVKNDRSLENVYVLSYHVDYWNRLGWEDPFSSKKNTDLQSKYGSKFGKNKVYTPQAVVNGDVEFVGSNDAELSSSINKALSNTAENTVEFSDMIMKEKEIRVFYQVNGDVTDRQLVVNLVIDRRSTKIGKGENDGKTLDNVNIVVQDFALPLMKTEGIVVINIPEIVKSSDKLSVVGFIQKENMEITGASAISVN